MKRWYQEREDIKTIGIVNIWPHTLLGPLYNENNFIAMMPPLNYSSQWYYAWLQSQTTRVQHALFLLSLLLFFRDLFILLHWPKAVNHNNYRTLVTLMIFLIFLTMMRTLYTHTWFFFRVMIRCKISFFSLKFTHCTNLRTSETGLAFPYFLCMKYSLWSISSKAWC